MAKRTIIECDLCKNEYDPEEGYIISVKKKGKQRGNNFDLCPSCAEKIQTQLVAKSSESLNTNWSFNAPKEVVSARSTDDDFIERKNQERLEMDLHAACN